MTLGIGFMIILAAGAILPAVAVMAALGYGMVTDVGDNEDPADAGDVPLF